VTDRFDRWRRVITSPTNPAATKDMLNGSGTRAGRRLAMTDQDDAHGGIFLDCKLSLFYGFAKLGQPEGEIENVQISAHLPNEMAMRLINRQLVVSSKQHSAKSSFFVPQTVSKDQLPY
jgi:hypothetical protein